MSAPIHILGIAGSLRKASINRGLLRSAAKLLPEGATLEIFELNDLPLFNEELEVDGFPAAVERFHERIAAADAILIATPEYNHGMPGVLKNAIDWASRPGGKAAILGKPASVIGASTSPGGTARAQSAVRQTLVPLDMPAVNRPEVRIALAEKKFDDEGNLTDEAAEKFLRDHLVKLVELARRYKK